MAKSDNVEAGLEQRSFVAEMLSGVPPSEMQPRLAREGVALGQEDYDQTEAPVWFLWGTDDAFLSPGAGRPWVERLSGATIDVVRGGHVPWFDAPDLACHRIASLAGSGPR